MKYGINIVQGAIHAISEFPEDSLPENFKEITKERYNELLDNFTPFSTWDESKGDFVEDEDAKTLYKIEAEADNYRKQLSLLLTEINLAEKLGENTNVLQGKFNNIEKAYKALDNKSPVVYAGIKQVITLPINTITLSGTATDKDGKVVSVNWVKVNGGSTNILNPNELSTKVNKLEAGNYVFRLTATDNNGASSASDVNVCVKPKGVVKISVSPKEKHNISASGTVFEVNVKSNTDWSIQAKGNSSVTPSSGIGNGKVTVKIHKNNSRASLLGHVEFRAEDKVTNFVWSQKGIKIDDDDFDDDIRCFDLESNVVMANGRSKKLKNIKIDDELLGVSFSKNIPAAGKFINAEDVLEKTKKSKVKVVDFGIETVDEYRRITLLNNTIIDVTASHPLLSSKDQKELAWLTPDELRAGMYLIDKNGKFVEIESKRTIKETLEIGVLHVKGGDNYMIQGVIVHNAKVVRAKTRAKEIKGALAIDADDVVKK